MSDFDPEELERLYAMIRQQREFYGLRPEPLVFPTLEEMKDGDNFNNGKLITKTISEHGGKKDIDDGVTLWIKSGIHDREMPWFAYETVMANCYTTESADDLIRLAWTLPEWPGQIGLLLWSELFSRLSVLCEFSEDCAYHKDGKRPTVTAWRGSFSSEKRGLSWTLSPERALWFVLRGDMSGKGRKMRLWECEVPAERQYAHFNERNESEIVADVRTLKIKDVTDTPEFRLMIESKEDS